MLRLIVQIHDTRLAQAPSFIGSSHCGCMFTVLALTSATAPARGGNSHLSARNSQLHRRGLEVDGARGGAVRLCLHRFL